MKDLGHHFGGLSLQRNFYGSVATPAHSDFEPTPSLTGETRWWEPAHFGERLGNEIGLSL